jgi:hypothetical protein
MSFWTVQGQFLETQSVSVPGYTTDVVGQLGGQCWLLATLPTPSLLLGLEPLYAKLFRVSPGRGDPVRLGEVYWWSTYTVKSGNGTTGYLAPFAARGLFATTETGFWYSAGSEPLLTLYSPYGDTLRQVRFDFSPPLIQDTDRRQYEREFFSSSSADEPRMRREIATIEFPKFFPAIVQLLSTRDGGAWVGFGVSSEATLRPWRLVANDGRVLVHLELSADYAVLDADNGFMLATRRDNFGVEYVDLLRLVPQVPPP